VDNRFEVQFFGGQSRQTLDQIKAHLITKHTDGTSTSSVVLAHTVLFYVTHQIKILLHEKTLK